MKHEFNSNYLPILLSLAMVVDADATVRYVNIKNLTAVPPYTNWATAATNIQDAVDASTNADSILVTNGIYATGGRVAYWELVSVNDEWVEIGITNRLAVTKSVTIQSVNGSAVTFIQGFQIPGTTNGDAAVRCAYLTNGATLVGFTLTNGATRASGNYQRQQSGGGIYCETSDVIVSNCAFVGNSASFSGGGVCQGTLNNCTLCQNYALNGFNSSGGGASYSILINCSLSENSASGGGGGAYSSTLNSCIISSNSAPIGGGAAGCALTNCVLIGNTNSFGTGPFGFVPNGGGASNSKLDNCLIVGNSAGYGNGGGANDSTLNNCTLVGNSASAVGGGVSGTADLNNCILYYNTAPAGPNCPVVDVWMTLRNCCTIPMPDGSLDGGGDFTNEPAFVDLSSGDFHLQFNSPCINTGNNAYVSTSTDLDGNPRIIGGAVDLGAYEAQPLLHYVALNGTNPIPPYTSWATAATNIEDAVDASKNSDLILVTNGVYRTGARIVYGSLTNRVVVDKAVALQSVNGPAATLIEGYQVPGTINDDGAVRCVYLANGAALSGFTLTNGATLGGSGDFGINSGGGLYCESADVVVTNCVIIGCAASDSGGGALGGTLNGCSLISNQSDNGGGADGSSLKACLLFGNSVGGNGGGANNCTADGCQFIGNSATYGGGAESCGLSNCTLMANGASYGGGADGSDLNNCLVVSNSVNATGAGAFDSTLNNCTVWGNSAADGTGGMQGTVARNCIVFDNDPANHFLSSLDYCCTWPLPDSGSGNFTGDPALIDPAGGDFHLQSNSPCINSGNNAYVIVTCDLDGNPRTKGGTVDIGAYEYQTPASVISYAWLQQYGLPTDGSADYKDTDGDGMNNFKEWIARTDPTDPLSILKMLATASTDDPAGVLVTWQSVSGRSYYLQRSEDLSAQPAFFTIQSDIIGQEGATSFVDTDAVGPGPYFYRVGVGN